MAHQHQLDLEAQVRRKFALAAQIVSLQVTLEQLDASKTACDARFYKLTQRTESELIEQRNALELERGKRLLAEAAAQGKVAPPGVATRVAELMQAGTVLAAVGISVLLYLVGR